MTAIILEGKSKSDFKLLIELSKKLGLYSKILTDEETEDLGLLKAMEEGRKTKFVDRSTIMKTLNKI